MLLTEWNQDTVQVIHSKDVIGILGSRCKGQTVPCGTIVQVAYPELLAIRLLCHKVTSHKRDGIGSVREGISQQSEVAAIVQVTGNPIGNQRLSGAAGYFDSGANAQDFIRCAVNHSPAGV